jgi:hypothetical protein
LAELDPLSQHSLSNPPVDENFACFIVPEIELPNRAYLPSEVQKSMYFQRDLVAVACAAPMSQSSGRIQLLGKQFESLALKLAGAQSLEERTKLLRQMKVLLIEIDQDSTNAVLH